MKVESNQYGVLVFQDLGAGDAFYLEGGQGSLFMRIAPASCNMRIGTATAVNVGHGTLHAIADHRKVTIAQVKVVNK